MTVVVDPGEPAAPVASKGLGVRFANAALITRRGLIATGRGRNFPGIAIFLVAAVCIAATLPPRKQDGGGPDHVFLHIAFVFAQIQYSVLAGFDS